MKFKLTGKKTILTAVLIIIIGLPVYFLYPPAYDPPLFPEGKKFAFTIIDDTDNATFENIGEVYDFFERLGLRTTKTVWVLPTNDTTEWANRGECLSDSVYREFILNLRDKGFEIALHGVRGGNSTRPEIIAALEEYREIIGTYPNIHINHAHNRDNLYWGSDKLSNPLFQTLYQKLFAKYDFTGHDPESENFWGDIAQEHINYVVNYSFFDINVLKVNPSMPYRDPDKPYVNEWFHTADGGSLASFNELISKENVDRLEAEGGVCLVYTHLAREFYLNGSLDSTFQSQMTYLAAKDGWFVPASQILEFLDERHKSRRTLSYREKVRLDLIWLYEKIMHGSS